MSDAGREHLRPRLLIVVNVFNPDRGGGGAIFSDLCYGLADLGYDVTVRCAYPYYPEWQDKTGRNGLRIQRYDEHGVRVERYGLFIPRNPNSLFQRLLYETSFLVSLARSLPRGRGFDMIMAYCPLVGAVAFAAVNKWLYRKPLWLNVQDLSADAAAASGIARGRFVKRCLSLIQGRLFNQADAWSSISPVMIDRLRMIRARNQPVLYLPNWLNASMADEIRQFRCKLGNIPRGEVKLLYAGNIGGKQDLLRFCRSLHESGASFVFRIHGNGAEAAAVEAWIRDARDPRFTFGPFLEERDFAKALYETDLFVITEKRGSGGSFIPCKMIAGVASGSPILAVSDPDSPLGREMAAYQVGPWFSWDDLPKVPEMLDQIPFDPGQFLTWQSNALARAKFYRRDHIIAGFDLAIRVLISGNRPSEDIPTVDV